MVSGTVKYYNSEQGFGLIIRADGEKDIRFTFATLKEAGITGIEERQRVTFDTKKDPKTGKIAAVALKLT